MKKTRRRIQPSSLAIVEKGFRGAIEEQYGNIVWLSEIMLAMGARHSLLLCGAAVATCFKEQKQQSIVIGDICVNTISDFKSSVESMLARGGQVWVLEKDLVLFGQQVQLIDGVNISPSIAQLCLEHDKVWFW